MKIILNETIDKLGVIGSEVTVPNGYARNYLLPQKKAVLATPQNRKIVEQKKIKYDLQIIKERKSAEELAKSIEGVKCCIYAKVGENDRLYGSVTSKNIADILEKQNIQLDKEMVLLEEPIKTIGTYEVPIRIYHDINTNIIVEVAPEEAPTN